MNLFEDSSAICTSTGQETDFSVLLGLLQALELDNEKYLNFGNKRFVEGFNFKAISKSNIKTSNKYVHTKKCKRGNSQTKKH